RARVAPPEGHAVDDVLDRRAAHGHRPERRRAGVLGRLLERGLMAHAPALPVERPHDRGDERPRLERPADQNLARQIAADRDAVADWTEAAALARARERGDGNLVNAPAARDAGDQHLGLEHEAAASRPDVVEELDRVDAEPRLCVAELEAARPVHEEARDPDRVQPVGRQRGGIVQPSVDHPQHRAVGARRGHDGADGLGLVEDRYDDQRGHAARARGPATTIATWLPPRATACTSASPAPASVAAVATARAASPEWRPAG